MLGLDFLCGAVLVCLLPETASRSEKFCSEVLEVKVNRKKEKKGGLYTLKTVGHVALCEWCINTCVYYCGCEFQEKWSIMNLNCLGFQDAPNQCLIGTEACSVRAVRHV